VERGQSTSGLSLACRFDRLSVSRAYRIDRKDGFMKLRSLFILAAGVGLGYSLATRMRQDDPDVVHGPQRRPDAQGGAAMRLVSDGAQRLADQAGVLSLDAIRRARVAIRARLGEDGAYTDDANWN
jgi:hypothetical protein